MFRMKKTLLSAALAAVITAAAGAAMPSLATETLYDQAVNALATATTPEAREDAMGQLEQALANGDGRAGVRLGTLALQQVPDLGDDAYQKAIGYFDRARALGAYGAGWLQAQAIAQRGYFVGKNTPRGAMYLDQARDLLEIAAKDETQSVPEVFWHLGYLEITGLGGPQDRKAGNAHIERAADMGHGMAALWVANQTTMDGKEAEERKLHYLQIAARAGIRAAQTQLASYEAAQAPLQMVAAVEKTHPVGPSDVAPVSPVPPVTLRDGIVEMSARDYASASASTSAAAEAVPSGGGASVEMLQGELASLRDQLAETNAALATAKAELASARESYRSAMAPTLTQLAEINQEGLQAVLNGNYEVAVQRFREGVKYGYAPAQANLGILILNGTGLPRDGRQAIALLEMAAKNGNLVASENIARAYDFGLGVPKNRARAIHWYQVALDMGSTLAQDALQRLRGG